MLLERERERKNLWWGAKKYNTKTYQPKIKFLKITMIHQRKVELQEIIKNEERGNNHFSRENARENKFFFIENNIRINNNKNIVITIKLSKSY